ncbi:hypothetical protein SPOG_05140 [Schizosaccharomyces cryophilus OY26]|uniref:Uncharacterized protein n=1 Tax=Schizosaccharomyces cryophilus (strain OY26 / ATCC MYA-4695 / CBS 11777 / NBRC 106824 / NRRL Y48691) TaxID=653667 RepID=S9VXH1_SCHCR|nr:uncharacterized protein SPOG_05140 [Schizosaccharomyces cryophilus OY26]EPY50874.1 hypothetical protein SPOG_05140 [Schizosaccharomyces cryophilus OY26]
MLIPTQLRARSSLLYSTERIRFVSLVDFLQGMLEIRNCMNVQEIILTRLQYVRSKKIFSGKTGILFEYCSNLEI